MKYDPGTKLIALPLHVRPHPHTLVGYSVFGFIGSNLVGRPLGALRQILSAIFKNLSLSLCFQHGRPRSPPPPRFRSIPPLRSRKVTPSHFLSLILFVFSFFPSAASLHPTFSYFTQTWARRYVFYSAASKWRGGGDEKESLGVYVRVCVCVTLGRGAGWLDTLGASL